MGTHRGDLGYGTLTPVTAVRIRPGLFAKHALKKTYAAHDGRIFSNIHILLSELDLPAEQHASTFQGQLCPKSHMLQGLLLFCIRDLAEHL